MSTAEQSSFNLKYRLTGAIVLFTLAVVVLPTILNGRGEATIDPEPAAVPTNQGEQLETFISRITPITEEEAAGPVAPAPGAGVDESPEQSLEAVTPTIEVVTTIANPDDENGPVIKTVPTEAPIKREEIAVARVEQTEPAAPPVEIVRAEPQPEPRPAPQAEPAVQSADPAPAIEKGWTVRVGTFSRTENANRLELALKKGGFAAHSELVSTDQGALTRVWVGPYEKRASASAALAKIKQITGEQGFITAFP